VLAFHGQHAFALGGVIALAEFRLDLGERWPPRLVATDPPPLKWSDLRYVSDIEEDGNGKEALQA